MTENRTIRLEDKHAIKDGFCDRECSQIGNIEIMGESNSKLELTYAFKVGDTVSLPFCKATLKPTMVLPEGFARKTVLEDGGGRAVGDTVRAELNGDFINVTIRFRTLEIFEAARAGKYDRVEIRFVANHWLFRGSRDVELDKITMTGAGLLSPAFRPRARRKLPVDFAVDPVVRIKSVIYDGPGSNVKIDEAKREIIVGFLDNQFFAPGTAENVRVNCGVTQAHFYRLINKPVFPSADGVRVPGCQPFGNLTEVHWESEEIDDPQQLGRKKSLAFAFAKIVFDKTPVGDAELAAFLGKQPRAVAFSLKAQRWVRDLHGKEYATTFTAWEPLSITIDGGTALPVETRDDASASPGDPPRRNFFQRALDVLSPAGGTIVTS
jgi:hypothetical protein